MIWCVKKIILFSLGIALAITANASDPLCHGKFLNPITDVCWSCLFPISIGAIKVFDDDNPDTENPISPICACVDPVPRIGISMGYWEPMALVDVTRNPYCMVNLGGISLQLTDHDDIGEVDAHSPDQGGSFYYVHWYLFPLINWLGILTDALCFQKSDFDIAYLTELDPLWRDDELSFILNPEAVLFGNGPAQTACAADSIAATRGSLPLDDLFWCAGSQGSMYPLTGHVQEHVGGVQASTLLSERMAYKMHREGLIADSDGSSLASLCGTSTKSFLPKSRYRYQMINPLPAASQPTGCKPFGYSTALWGANHEYPHEGEDFGYLIWRKRNCCAF